MGDKLTSTGQVIHGPWQGGVRQQSQRVRRQMQRAWQAAKNDRLTADWLSHGGDINQELRHQLPILRARARELEQNNNQARRYLKLVETHVVGPNGFLLRVKGKQRNGKLDSRGNAAVEAGFKRWARRGVCEITGKLSFVDAERVSARTCARDGEYLIRMHDFAPTRDNPFGFAIELLDPVRLDHQLNVDLPNGNRVRLGVELNGNNRPVAYYLLRGAADIYGYTAQKHERVPAEDLIHGFYAERPEQLRGFTWMCSSMLGFHMMGAFQDAAVTAARVGASKMGFFRTPTGTLRDHADDITDDGELIDEAEPGHFDRLPHGWDFVDWNPDYPHQNYEPFVRSINRDNAVGLNVAYHAMTSDLTDVNFSSIRAGTIEEREHWMVIQNWFADGALVRICNRWLGNAVLHNALSIRVGQDEAMARFSEHQWRGRRWPWVDPLKDIEAVTRAIALGLKSPQQAADELGVDLEDMLDQIAAAIEMAKERGLDFGWLGNASEVVAQQSEEGNASSKN